jgi:hypothetical protein
MKQTLSTYTPTGSALKHCNSGKMTFVVEVEEIAILNIPLYSKLSEELHWIPIED